MAKRNDKRSRLVSAADQLFHQQGVNITTLANIAQMAEVPLGNVYYYFKSKISIVSAVIDYRRNLMRELLENINHSGDQLERLRNLILQYTTYNELAEKYGDAVGSLCLELSKQQDEIAEQAAGLMYDIIAWCEHQFIALGQGNKSHELALSLVSRLQGVSLMMLTFKNQEYTQSQANSLLEWVNAIAGQQHI